MDHMRTVGEQCYPGPTNSNDLNIIREDTLTVMELTHYKLRESIKGTMCE